MPGRSSSAAFLAVAGDGECEIRQIFTPGECVERPADLHAELEAQYAGT